MRVWTSQLLSLRTLEHLYMLFVALFFSILLGVLIGVLTYKNRKFAAPILRNDKNIISSISVADIIFDEYLGKWNYRAILKVKT